LSKLVLVPTPIDDSLTLDSGTLDALRAIENNADHIILVEEHKVARRRWISWGLDRSSIDKFYLYNEHNSKTALKELISFLKDGKTLYLLSDCGLPAFCDPGQELVNACHQQGIEISSFPFHNSVILALVLSGFYNDEFIFSGFLPRDKDKRSMKIKSIINNSMTNIIMDTPYRLKNILVEFDYALKKSNSNREIFLAMELGSTNERLFRGSISEAVKRFSEYKKRFIFVINKR
jgi:16S rRNA (cytidine1402-2'-O)-methyltransferase